MSKGVSFMKCRFSDLKCKEVINVCSGLRMGFVSDAVINACTGQILSIVVPGQGKCLGLLGRDDDYVIPWECIRKIGDDIILVEIDEEHCREKRERRSWM